MIGSIEINLSLEPIQNNLSGCFWNFKTYSDNSSIMPLNELRNLIDQAKKLGAETIILYDDYKTPYINFAEIQNYINDLNLTIQTFSDKNIGALPQNPNYTNCFKHKYSCFITLDGNVFPCQGLPLPIGNLHDHSLKKILEDSEIIENLKNHTHMIKGPCRKCPEFTNCYGCRGRAFALTGDYLASDPVCQKNHDKLEQITYLPMKVDKLIPQQKGMKVVSSLLNVEERFARVQSIFSDTSPFVNEDGSLEEIAYMEIMAQSAAVMNGFSKFDTGALPPGGFLLGGQKINIYKKTFANEKLITDIYKTAKFGNFGILTATIKREQEIIAEGEIKIFQNDGENNEI